MVRLPVDGDVVKEVRVNKLMLFLLSARILLHWHVLDSVFPSDLFFYRRIVMVARLPFLVFGVGHTPSECCLIGSGGRGSVLMRLSIRNTVLALVTLVVDGASGRISTLFWTVACFVFSRGLPLAWQVALQGICLGFEWTVDGMGQDVAVV